MREPEINIEVGKSYKLQGFTGPCYAFMLAFVQGKWKGVVVNPWSGWELGSWYSNGKACGSDCYEIVAECETIMPVELGKLQAILSAPERKRILEPEQALYDERRWRRQAEASRPVVEG